jgi:hypothetical protein
LKEPNLQNIPIRTELGKEIRAAFSEDEHDEVFIMIDLSEIELRVLAGVAAAADEKFTYNGGITGRYSTSEPTVTQRAKDMEQHFDEVEQFLRDKCKDNELLRIGE